jgi:hypothetical protein
MQNSINSESTCKGRFLRRLNLAGLCLDADQPGMARPILEELEIETERFSLDQWDPELCLKVWTSLNRCYQDLVSKQTAQGKQEVQSNNGFYNEKAGKIFEKICRLDIRAAFSSNAK